MSVISNFRRAATLVVAGGVGITGCAEVYGQSPEINRHEAQNTAILKSPLTMGGYREAPAVAGDFVIDSQKKYMRDRAELEAAMHDCALHKISCNPHVDAFSKMLAQAKKISGRLTQVVALDAWVNIAIAYDDKETKSGKTDLDNHSLKETLTGGKAICDEIGRLKLFGLEKLGFANDDIRWIGMDTYNHGKEEDVGHTVTEVRIKGKTWIMDLPPSGPTSRRLSQKAVKTRAIDASHLQTSEAQLNFSGNSYWLTKETYVPSSQFNAVQAGGYKPDEAPLKDLSNVPKAAREAKAEWVSLKDDTFKEVGGERFFASAFAFHYKIVKQPSILAFPLPKRPITMGGFAENARYDGPIDILTANRERYIKDKAALEKELRACAEGNTSCDPRIAAFGRMIEQVGKIKNKLTQVKIVNAWVNIAIEYDNSEALRAKHNSDHLALKQSLQRSKGICDEIARLKLFALEKLGFSEDDMRWVAEVIFVRGKKDKKNGHAVTEVRVNGKSLIMNVSVPEVKEGILTRGEALARMMLASKMETAAAQVNFSGHSFSTDPVVAFLPIYSFNAAQGAVYVSDNIDPYKNPRIVPPHTRHAKEETVSLDLEFLQKGGEQILASAFSPHYRILPSGTRDIALRRNHSPGKKLAF